jgi:hypothetical protein
MNWYNTEVFGASETEAQAADASRIEEALEDDDNDAEQSWGKISYQGNRTYEAIPVDEGDGNEGDFGEEQPILVRE